MPNLRSTRRKRRRSTPLSFLEETSASGVYWPSAKLIKSPKTPSTPPTPSSSSLNEKEPSQKNEVEPLKLNEKKKAADGGSNKVVKKNKQKTSRKKPSKKAESKATKTKSKKKSEAKADEGSIQHKKALVDVTVIGDSGHFLEYRSEITARDDDNYWASLQEQKESWICYQFDELVKVADIGIRDRNDQMAPKTIKVEVSVQNPEENSWETVLDRGDLSEATLMHEDKIKWLSLEPTDGPVRFVKVWFLENFGSPLHYVVKQVLFRT